MPTSVTAASPKHSLQRVLDDLGTTLLDLVCGDPGRAASIACVAIHDPVDDLAPPRQGLVLGVGVHDPDELAALLVDLGRHHAVGLVVRAPVPREPQVIRAVERSGVALLGLTRGVSWARLGDMLRSLLVEDSIGDATSQALGGIPSGDLFALANAIAAVLDAPVTIEDCDSRVVAFSDRQDKADQSRVETVLGRQVPERFTRILEERDVFRDLYQSDQPVCVDLRDLGMEGFALPRVAVAVRAGGEILGSIWAAVPTTLNAEKSQSLCAAAQLAALHMLRLRAEADVGRRLRAELVTAALEGGPGAHEAIRRLGLLGQPAIVLAMGLVDQDGAEVPADFQALQSRDRHQLSDALAMHLTATMPRSAVALVGDTSYAVVPASNDRTCAEDRVVRIVSDFLQRTGDRVATVIGVGSFASDATQLARSRSSAERALRVLRTSGGVRRVAKASDVYVESILLELRDTIAARAEVPADPVARLLAYDAKHNACLVETLRAWLDSFGDVVAASAAIYIHPNTFRYRLRRLAQIADFDTGDPEARFEAMLQLRLLAPARSAGVPEP